MIDSRVDAMLEKGLVERGKDGFGTYQRRTRKCGSAEMRISDLSSLQPLGIKS